MSDRLWWGIVAGVLAVAAVAYLPVLDNGLVWDDWTNVAADPPFQAGARELAVRAFTDVRLGHWQPLAWISLGADYALWGDDPRGFHLTNVLIHFVNGVLFAVGARRLLLATATGQAIPSWAAVGSLGALAVFALHPLRVETVAWVTERRHLLSAAFFLAAVVIWLAALDRRSLRPRPGLAAAAVGSYGLSLLATPLGVALPLVLLIADLWPLRRWSRAWGGWKLAALVYEKLPFLALASVFSVSALLAQHASAALASIDRYTTWQRLAQAAYGALFYPRAMLALAWYPLYEQPSGLQPLEPRFALSVLGCLAITITLVALRRRWPAGLAVWLAYLVLLAPVSGLAQAGVQLVADRYSYLSCLPFALLLGGALASTLLEGRGRVGRTAAALAFAALVGYWSVATRAQTRVWKDDVTLWRHVTSGGPSSHAHHNLAMLALQAGELGEALEHATQAIEIAPRYSRAWRGMISLLERREIGVERDRLKRAAQVLEASLSHQHGAPEAWYALGLARAAGGEHAAAVPAFEQAVAAEPSFAPGWRAMVLAHAAAGQWAEVRETIERGLRAIPDDPMLLKIRSSALERPAAGSPS